MLRPVARWVRGQRARGRPFLAVLGTVSTHAPYTLAEDCPLQQWPRTPMDASTPRADTSAAPAAGVAGAAAGGGGDDGVSAYDKYLSGVRCTDRFLQRLAAALGPAVRAVDRAVERAVGARAWRRVFGWGRFSG
jgi:hypothetical protein